MLQCERMGMLCMAAFRTATVVCALLMNMY